MEEINVLIRDVPKEILKRYLTIRYSTLFEGTVSPPLFSIDF